MKKLQLLSLLIAGLLLASCSKKNPDFVKTIPDNAFAVISMHPQQIFEKGKLNSFENIKKEISEEFLLEILEDPSKSGIVLDDYSYFFVYFKEEAPILGFVSGMKSEANFKALIEKIKEKAGGEIIDNEGISMYSPDEEATLAWNADQVLFLGAFDHNYSSEEMMAEVSRLFNLEKENSITSMVDFNDFTGKMKDLNIWVSSDEVRKMMETMDKMKDMNINFPMDLYNNYGQFFFEFENGAMYMHSESHFSEEVEKNVEQFMVTKPKINEALLKNTPGGDLLFAMAVSMDLEKFKEMLNKIGTENLPDISGKIEEATGVPADEIWNALNGDFVIAVNGANDGGMVPFEAFVGIGLKNDELQKKLMGTAGGMLPVEDHGDFFLINTNGLEIYSGITDNIWVVTNSKGYKDNISGSGLPSSLKDSKFMDYASGGMGMYLNLDLSTYPAMVQTMMSQNEEASKMLEAITGSLTSLGVEASQYENNLTLLTAKKDENSLYTLLKLADELD